MRSPDISRRRVLGTICGTGAVGLAGCSSSSGSGSSYACTDIDDEPTERYDQGDNPIPYTFEIPEMMSVENVNDAENAGRVAFTRGWKDHRGIDDTYRHSIDLEVDYGLSRGAVVPMTITTTETGVTVLGKRNADGMGVGLIERDATETMVRLEIPIPSTVDGAAGFVRLRVEASAILQGRRVVEEDARSDDPDQTCQEALRAVAVAVIDSVPVVSPADAETTLDITPSSATVRRGGSVDFTIEASAVGGVDLLIDADGEFSHEGSLAVGDDPLRLTVAPPDDDGGDVITARDAEGSRTLEHTEEIPPGTYSVTAQAPGTDGHVRSSASLTVEPAN